MRRRNVLKSLAVTAGTVTTGLGGMSAMGPPASAESFPPLYFDSTTGLLDAAGNPLTDPSLVSVYAHESAVAVDSDANEDVTPYGSDPIALVATDGQVVTTGCPFVTDDTDWSFGNEEFMLNVWDELFEGGTILWDESHEQYYHLGRFGTFEAYAESQGYTVEPTTDLRADLDRAAGVVVSTPKTGFTEDELAALSAFLLDGGGLIVHSQSDYRNFDATGNLNVILSALGVDIRFNDAQIVDREHSTGPEYMFTTDRFSPTHSYFGSRPGIGPGPRFDVDSTYEATVESIADGDTLHVRISEGRERVRVLGVDTPELPSNAEFEVPHEWPGLGDEADGTDLDGEYPILATWAENGRKFAQRELSDETVTLSFDENEGTTDPFGRLLGHVHYDADGSGSRDTSFAQRLLETGHARTYHSGMTRHDEFLSTELHARAAGTGVWAGSDLTASSAYRNTAVEEVFIPNPVPVSSDEMEDLPDSRAVVRAEESASHPQTPLVAIDTESRVAFTGGLLVNDVYEMGSDFSADVSRFDNFMLLTNILRRLSGRAGGVLVAGGNGQFGASGSLTAEATAFYQRHLEGGDMALEGVNDLTTGHLDDARAVLITAPPESFEGPQLQVLRAFRDNGGAVVLMGSGAADSSAILHLNTIAMHLGTDLRVALERVTDPASNVAGDESLLVTSRFSAADALYDASESTEPRGGERTASPRRTDADPSTSGRSGSGFGVLTALVGIAGGAAASLRSRTSPD